MQQNTDAGFWIGLKNIVEVSTQGQVNQPPPDSTYGADPPQKSSSTLKKRTSVRGSPDYIKKPLNAFMLYAKENRPILKMLYEKKDSASINKLLGQMWKTLSQYDKQKYFEEAQRLNDEHAIMYPNWSTRDNYGKTKKKKCCHAAPSSHQVDADPGFVQPVTAYPSASPTATFQAAPATVPDTWPFFTSFDVTTEFQMPLSLELELNDFFKEHGDMLFDEFEDLDLSVFDL
ncbi:transcription factor 7-like 1-A [Stigmatopora argus]